MNEIWIDIKGYEGKYKVSNLGNIKSLNYKNSGEEHCLSLCNDKDGYLLVSIRKNDKSASRRVHRIVAENFIPRIEGKNQINHKDGNKKNNCVDNLEWCTHAENQRHAWDKGLKKWTDELKKKHSERMSGKNNPNFGKSRPEETKIKISKANTGKVSPNKGKPMSEEQKQKISKTKKSKNKRKN